MNLGLTIRTPFSRQQHTGQLALRSPLVFSKATPTLQAVDNVNRSWWPIFGTLVDEFDAGEWQRNITRSPETVLAYFAVYACVRLISSDIAKLPLRLVQKDRDDIWTEITNPAYDPVIRNPNHYQLPVQFYQWWMVSKLTRGNTYVLKQRDGRGVVSELFLLDPARVRPLVAPDSSVYYEMASDNLAGLQEQVIVPASEIIHDRMVPLFHPLVGVSPIYACGLGALQGLKIQNNSHNFFANGARPGGVLTAPGSIKQETADRIKATWEANFSGENAGKVAVLGDGLHYEAMSMTAVDAQLIEQLRFSAEQVCAAFGVPFHKMGFAQAPNYNNVEALNLQYYSQCLQVLVRTIEDLLDKGLGLGPEFGNTYGVEFDKDELWSMDTKTLIEAEGKAVGSGITTPNESRFKLNLKPVPGGDTPYLQQQNYSLEALDARDRRAIEQPTITVQPTPPAGALPPAAAEKAAPDTLTLRKEATRLALRAFFEDTAA